MAGGDLSPFTLSQGVLISYTAGIGLGLYLISLAFANRWLLFTDEGWEIRSNVHWFITATTNLIAVLVVINQEINVDVTMAESRFVEQGHTLKEYVEKQWRLVLKCSTVITVVLLADVVLIYRLWTTQMKRWKLLWFPVILWFGCLVCTVLEIVLQASNHPDFGPYKWGSVKMGVGPGIVLVPQLGMSIILNAYCTGLLMWRIWGTLNKSGSGTNNKQLRFLVRVIMESGILYLSVSIANFGIWFGFNNFAIHLAGSILVASVGIAGNLIIIRVGRGRADEGCHQHEKLTTLQFVEVNQLTSIDSSSTT